MAAPSTHMAQDQTKMQSPTSYLSFIFLDFDLLEVMKLKQNFVKIKNLYFNIMFTIHIRKKESLCFKILNSLLVIATQYLPFKFR